MARHSTAFERPRDLAGTLRRLWGYLSRFRWSLALALALTIAGNLLALVGPQLAGMAIDAMGTRPGQADFRRVARCCALMVVCYVVSAAMQYALNWLMVSVGQRTVYRMRQDLFDHLMAMRVGYFDRHPVGDVVSRMSYDIDTVNASLSNDLLQIVTSAITVVGALGMMVAISPELTLVFVVTVPASVAFTTWLMRKVRPLFRRRSASLGALNGYAEEILSGQRTVRAYHRERTMEDRFARRNDEAVEAYYDADYYGSMTGPSVNFLSNLSLAFVSVFGAILYLVGSITLGNLSSFVLYSRRFSGPINEVANIISDLQSSMAAAERVFRMIDEPGEPADPPGARPCGKVRGDVRLERVSFAYGAGGDAPDGAPHGAPHDTLHDVSLHAAPGSLTAIVGHTGAGKTTLVNLLMRFYDPTAGRILLDGVDVRDLTRAGVRRAFSMVLQDPWLFHGTVHDNIAFCRPDATRAEVEAAARAAHADGFIRSLPQGYDTVLDENAEGLSAGQRRLVTIARAMLADAPMRIMDEATSSVDTRTEREVQAAMTGLMRGRTCFVIAHRLSTIERADQILVMDHGRIVERGTHAGLLARGGVYAELYRAQFA